MENIFLSMQLNLYSHFRRKYEFCINKYICLDIMQ